MLYVTGDVNHWPSRATSSVSMNLNNHSLKPHREKQCSCNKWHFFTIP